MTRPSLDVSAALDVELAAQVGAERSGRVAEEARELPDDAMRNRDPGGQQHQEEQLMQGIRKRPGSALAERQASGRSFRFIT